MRTATDWPSVATPASVTATELVSSVVSASGRLVVAELVVLSVTKLLVVVDAIVDFSSDNAGWLLNANKASKTASKAFGTKCLDIVSS